MAEPTVYLGVLIEQDPGGMVTMKFSDQHYRHPQLEDATIWKAMATVLEHYFTTHSETLHLVKGEVDNVFYLPKKLEAAPCPEPTS